MEQRPGNPGMWRSWKVNMKAGWMFRMRLLNQHRCILIKLTAAALGMFYLCFFYSAVLIGMWLWTKTIQPTTVNRTVPVLWEGSLRVEVCQGSRVWVKWLTSSWGCLHIPNIGSYFESFQYLCSLLWYFVSLFVFCVVHYFLDLACTPTLPGGARNTEFAYHCLQHAQGDIEVSFGAACRNWNGKCKLGAFHINNHFDTISDAA